MGTLRSVLEKIDRTLGDGLERTVCGHHQRRMRKLGWGDILEPETGPWATRRPVREGNRVEVLIDGDSALPAMAEAIAGAKSHVHLAGWHATPEFRLSREPGAPTLRELLATTAERVPVRFLLWAGPPLPVFQPTRGRAKAARHGLTEGTKVRCELDSRERTMHCHHEKILVVDDEVAFVGGLDFTALDGDRHDTSGHRPDRPLGWHDVAVRLHGPVVADVAEHFRQRWIEIAGEELPEPAVPGPAGTTPVQFVRTVPEKTYDFAPRGEFTILDAYLRALRGAESLVYLENQFLWSPEVVEILVAKLQRPPSDRFRLVLVLPRRPSSGSDTTKGQLGRLIDADDGAGRLLATTLTAHQGEPGSAPGNEVPVYVHAKVGIIDDTWLTVGSANLNEHSLFNDTEVNVVLNDPELVRDTRLTLWAEHLQRPVHEIDGDPAEVIDTCWRPLAEAEAERERRGEHRTHRLALLTGVSKRAERLNGPIRGLLVDG